MPSDRGSEPSQLLATNPDQLALRLLANERSGHCAILSALLSSLGSLFFGRSSSIGEFHGTGGDPRGVVVSAGRVSKPHAQLIIDQFHTGI